MSSCHDTCPTRSVTVNVVVVHNSAIVVKHQRAFTLGSSINLTASLAESPHSAVQAINVKVSK